MDKLYVPPRVLLASQSPYRKELLSRILEQFDCTGPLVNEDVFKDEINDPFILAGTLAKAKAESVAQNYPDHIIIGSDQVLDLNGSHFGKPGNFENAFIQIKNLQGKTHRLLTAVTVKYQKEEISFINITQLKMRLLTDEQIEYYINADKPFDCAGSYKIESKGIKDKNEVVC